jgi:hypothetical protein
MVELPKTYFCAWVPVVIRVLLVLGHFLGILLPNLALTHLLANSGIELAHLAALSHRVASFVEIL